MIKMYITYLKSTKFKVKTAEYGDKGEAPLMAGCYVTDHLKAQELCCSWQAPKGYIKHKCKRKGVVQHILPNKCTLFIASNGGHRMIFSTGCL